MNITLERISRRNALVYREARLAALLDAPSAFSSTWVKESQLTDADWIHRAARWSSSRSIGYLAMDRDIPCGLLVSYFDDDLPHRATLISMWVAPAYRRAGVGARLVNAIAVWAAAHGARELHLFVTGGNDGAAKFYQRLGFTKTGCTQPYPIDPSILEYEMTCPIPAH